MKRIRNTVLSVLMVTGPVLLSQCSPRTGRSLLTFFFDGVPPEDTTILDSVSHERASADSVLADKALAGSDDPGRVVHGPYAERECAACHDPLALGTMVESQPGLCYLCHEDLGTRFDYLHGPVAGGYCTACHHPHEAEARHLLRFTGDALCFFCHREESVLRNEMHQDLGGMECAECHHAHGGEDQYILH